MANGSKIGWWIVGGGVALFILSQGNRYKVMNDLSKVRLGKYFTLDEFVKTSTGLDNIPPPEIVKKLERLVLTNMDPLREEIGFPIYISSGYRSDAVNEAVPGSSSTSQHPKGEANDFMVLFKGKTKEQVLALIKHKGWTDKNIEWAANHNCYKLTNQTIIDVVRRLKLPYDQLIDEQRGTSLWVHLSHAYSGNQRVAWLTRRDPSPARPKEYALVKNGYA